MIAIFNGCTKGEDGKAGSSNVTSTTFNIATWAYRSPYYYADLNVPGLTIDNINSVGVMVYFNATSNNNIWSALPYTQYNSPSNYFMGFVTKIDEAAKGVVVVNWFYDSSLSSGDDPNTFYSNIVKFKVVVIPPSAKSLKSNSNINYKNYNEVREAFDLKD